MRLLFALTLLVLALLLVAFLLLVRPAWSATRCTTYEEKTLGRLQTLCDDGTETAEIGRQLGIPRGTVSSRAYTLVRQGKIQARPRGGAYPTQRRQSALAGVSPDISGVPMRVSDDTPQRSGRVSRRVSIDTPPPQYLPPSEGELSPLLHEILQEVRHLTGALAVRVSADTPQLSDDTPRVPSDTHRVSDGVSARTPLPAERGKSVRWNLHLSERLREHIKALAAERGFQDSQMVEELLWRALALVEDETP
jgi:hypothetical protein